jgi:hypothetical protein
MAIIALRKVAAPRKDLKRKNISTLGSGHAAIANKWVAWLSRQHSIAHHAITGGATDAS